MSEHVTIYYGPYEAFYTLSHKPQKLNGLKVDVLDVRGTRGIWPLCAVARTWVVFAFDASIVGTRNKNSLSGVKGLIRTPVHVQRPRCFPTDSSEAEVALRPPLKSAPNLPRRCHVAAPVAAVA
ncbi:hypothetical protein EVAR_8896_1 [Eumeta japonica]|uniref:Uncharacterized protein n=1 Tax=Eumeta variegata TaxID=151549 RepID=A0A4C1U1M9_EUMVA|nr:hypothetical protein EVAR_8896_1 [Eumeta japonica]